MQTSFIQLCLGLLFLLDKTLHRSLSTSLLRIIYFNRIFHSFHQLIVIKYSIFYTLIQYKALHIYSQSNQQLLKYWSEIIRLAKQLLFLNGQLASSLSLLMTLQPLKLNVNRLTYVLQGIHHPDHLWLRYLIFHKLKIDPLFLFLFNDQDGCCPFFTNFNLMTNKIIDK